MDCTKLENDMYDTANRIVGNVGPGVEVCVEKCGVVNYLPHPLACFVQSIEYFKIMDVWTRWVESYAYFRKYHCPEGAPIAYDPDLVIRWLRKPTVVRANHVVCCGVSAYLVICRADAQSWRLPHDKE